jgi:lysophospholipase L1-like esterase
LQHPEAQVEFIALGLPSETVSGLSEPGHAGGAFPRPNLHERLGRVLAMTEPDWIVACYGMNDGIYFPFSETRAKAFQDGLRQLREQAAFAGAQVLHVTPPVFDPVPLAGRTLPAGRDSYPSPFEGYNEVLDRYSEWMVGRRADGWQVVDAHGPMNRFLAERRRTDPAFLLAGDGVHANSQGHWLIAREVLRHLGAPEVMVEADGPAVLVASHPRGAEVLKWVQERQRLMKDPWLTRVGHVRPGMGTGRPWDEAMAEAKAMDLRIREAIKPSDR